MKTNVVFIIFALGLFFIISSAFSKPKPSGLSKIMKQMLVFIESEKEQIQAEKPPLKFPTDIARITKAKVTTGKKLSPEHTGYVKDFFEELTNYYRANNLLERKACFNLMVNSCIKCHQHECPGPISTIRKNLIPAKE